MQPLKLCIRILSTFQGFVAITPKKNQYPLVSHSLNFLSLRPQQPPLYFLSLRICLFWAFHISRTIQYAAFFDCRLSFSVTLSRLIHGVAYISTQIPFCVQIICHFYKYTTLLIHPSVDDE